LIIEHGAQWQTGQEAGLSVDIGMFGQFLPTYAKIILLKTSGIKFDYNECDCAKFEVIIFLKHLKLVEGIARLPIQSC
jgi:hypothetical protein